MKKRLVLIIIGIVVFVMLTACSSSISQPDANTKGTSSCVMQQEEAEPRLVMQAVKSVMKKLQGEVAETISSN